MKRKTNRGRAALISIIAMLLIAAGALLLFRGSIRRMIDHSRYRIDYAEQIKSAASEHGLDPFLVAAVVRTESRFDPNAVSKDGALGLMQVLPSTAEWIDFRRGTELPEDGLFDPETNLDYGCWLLSFLLKRYGGNERYALIAYNAGFGRLDDWLKDGALLDESGELASIPYPETRSYVDRIAHYKQVYGEIYEEELGKTQ